MTYLPSILSKSIPILAQNEAPLNARQDGVDRSDGYAILVAKGDFKHMDYLFFGINSLAAGLAAWLLFSSFAQTSHAPETGPLPDRFIIKVALFQYRPTPVIPDSLG
jgi:hypothetical protein